MEKFALICMLFQLSGITFRFLHGMVSILAQYVISYMYRKVKWDTVKVGGYMQWHTVEVSEI